MEDILTIEDDNSVTITFEKYGQKKFLNIEELEIFINKEINYWSWITGPVVNFRGEIQTRYNLLRDSISSLKNNPERLPNATKSLTQFNNQIKKEEIFLKEDPIVEFLEKLKESSKNIASFAAVYLHNYNYSFGNSQESIKGVMEIELFKRSLSNQAAQAYNDSMLDIIQASKERSGKNRIELEELKCEFVAFSKQINEFYVNYKDEAKQELEKNKQDFKIFLKDSKSSLDSTHETYKNLMSLKSPVKYWKDVALNNDFSKKRLLWLLVFELLFGGIFLFCMGNKILLKDGASFNYGKVSFLLLLSFIFMWAIKLTSQLLMSNIHISTEAKEKAVMTEAFLSLLEEGNVSEVEREIVFKSIFRPSGTGLLKNEDTGHFGVDAITKVIQQK